VISTNRSLERYKQAANLRSSFLYLSIVAFAALDSDGFSIVQR
jgi:hypothetical protein